MAAAILSEPGTKYGPCKSDCHHVDCQATKNIAYANCQVCGTQIGWETRFYTDPQSGRSDLYVHARCIEK